MNRQFDIVIAGGGMVGLVMAAALADLDLKILLLEKHSFDALSQINLHAAQEIAASDYDLRVSAISPGNQAFLKTLNIWQAIPVQRRADYQWMRVWDGDGSGSIEFDAAELAAPCLGSIVENSLLRAAAYQRLQQCNNVTLRGEQSVKSLHENDDKLDIELADGQWLTTRLLIGADGAGSDVRRLLAIPSSEQAYRQTAFVATVETELPHQDTAWQCFTRQGPVAFLPLPQANLCSIVWSLDDTRAQQIAGLSRAAFAEQLARAFEHRLGEVSLHSDFVGFPLVKRHSEHYLAPRCALVGDAAHTIHPLAGQGVNLGFQDVACLAQRIRLLVLQKRDIGLMANLRAFERERKSENTLMQNAMSGFKWLFGESGLMPTILRNQLLSAGDRSGPLKRLIIYRAMGLK